MSEEEMEKWPHAWGKMSFTIIRLELALQNLGHFVFGLSFLTKKKKTKTGSAYGGCWDS